MNKYEIFKQLHHQPAALIIGNAWNAHSAIQLEKSGMQALGTSSAAIAHSLGYEDGERMSFDELLFIVKRIIASVTVPVSVDIEGGYSKTISGILDHLDRLYEAGVVGINIEDSVMTTSRNMIAVEAFCKKLEAIKNHCTRNNIRLFINARTDTFLLDLPARIDDTLIRVKAYEAAGADGIFVPCIVADQDIRKVVAATRLPVHVLSMPGLGSFKTLSAMGVKRISMGNFAYDKMMGYFSGAIQNIQEEQSFESLFRK